MTPNVRIFASEQGAVDADALLGEHGFDQRTLLLPSQIAGKETDAVKEAIDAGTMPDRTERLAVRSLTSGRAVLAVRAPFGSGEMALELMERGGDTVDVQVIQNYGYSNPSPLSDALGLPTLVPFSSSTSLARSDWSLSSMFGMGLLSKRAAPLSSMFGMKILTKGEPSRTSGFGMPLLSSNPSPLSSLFGMGTLSKRPKEPRNSSFGFPLLIRRPAPLSNLLGAKTLSGDKRD